MPIKSIDPFQFRFGMTMIDLTFLYFVDTTFIYILRSSFSAMVSLKSLGRDL